MTQVRCLHLLVYFAQPLLPRLWRPRESRQQNKGEGKRGEKARKRPGEGSEPIIGLTETGHRAD